MSDFVFVFLEASLIPLLDELQADRYVNALHFDELAKLFRRLSSDNEITKADLDLLQEFLLTEINQDRFHKSAFVRLICSMIAREVVSVGLDDTALQTEYLRRGLSGNSGERSESLNYLVADLLNRVFNDCRELSIGPRAFTRLAQILTQEDRWAAVTADSGRLETAVGEYLAVMRDPSRSILGEGRVNQFLASRRGRAAGSALDALPNSGVRLTLLQEVRIAIGDRPTQGTWNGRLKATSFIALAVALVAFVVTLCIPMRDQAQFLDDYLRPAEEALPRTK